MASDTMQTVKGLHLRVLLPPIQLRFGHPLPLLIQRARARGRTKVVPLPPKVGGKERMRILLLAVIQPALGLVLNSLRENALRPTSVPLLTRSLRLKGRLSVMNGHRRRKLRRRAVETILVLPSRTLRNAAGAAYIRGNCKKGAKCNLHHIDIGEHQTVPSAPASSSNQSTGSASVGPVIVDSSNAGFVNSILGRIAPAFTPGPRGEARGSASR